MLRTIYVPTIAERRLPLQRAAGQRRGDGQHPPAPGRPAAAGDPRAPARDRGQARQGRPDQPRRARRRPRRWTRFDERAKQRPSSIDTDLYRVLAREGKREWPTVGVAPALFEAGTDAVPWRERGIPVYGVYPYPISRAELADMHGNDERISIRRLEEGTDMLTRVLRGAAAR